MNQDFPNKNKIPEHWLYWTFCSPDLLKKPLRTTNNQAVTIVDPGRINHDNGPDIRNAVLDIDGIVQKGDIEFHVAGVDWFRHGHHEDRRYQNLILHVLWDAPQAIAPALLSRFPHLILRRQLTMPVPLWKEKMNLLEAQEPLVGQKIVDLRTVSLLQLKNYGQARFLHKVDRLQCWLEQFSFEDILMISLAEVLGYSKNKFPLRQLLWKNPPSEIFHNIPRLFGSALGVWVYLAIQADFLNTQSFTHLKVRQNPIVEKVHQFYVYFTEKGVTPILKVEDWNFSRVRPANNPIVRLGALAQILFQFQGASLFKKLLQSAMSRLSLNNLIADWHSHLYLRFGRELSAAIQSMFNIPVSTKQIVGSQRINQFIINAVFPLLYLWAGHSGNPGFQHYISGLYEEFPACENAKIIRQVGAQLSNASLELAVYQQGVLELFAEQSLKYIDPFGQMKIF
jgi:hypothetical protein